MSDPLKPKLRRERGVWVCRDLLYDGRGHSPKAAYDEWAMSLRLANGLVRSRDDQFGAWLNCGPAWARLSAKR